MKYASTNFCFNRVQALHAPTVVEDISSINSVGPNSSEFFSRVIVRLRGGFRFDPAEVSCTWSGARCLGVPFGISVFIVGLKS